MPRFLRQFGLRTLLLVCSLAAVCFGVVRWHMDVVHRQEEAVNFLAEHDAIIQRKFWGPKWLIRSSWYRYFSEVIHVDLEVADDMVDKDFKVLEDLPAIERLYFPINPEISDAALDYLKGSKHLRKIILHGTGITDEGLSKLAHLHELEVLNINNTKITQSGLSRLVGLPKLEVLEHNVVLTDEGVAAVAQLPVAKMAYLRVRGLTEKGFAQLQNVRFYRIAIENPQAEQWTRFLCGHAHMDGLTIRKAEINDDQLQQIISTNKLYRLSLVDVPITDKVLPTIVAQPELRVLELTETWITANEILRHYGDQGFGELKIDPSGVEFLKIGSYVSNVTYSASVALDHLPGLSHAGEIDHLEIKSFGATIDLSHLSPTAKFESIHLSGTLEDSAWVTLARLKHLRFLKIEGSSQAFQPAELAAIKDCTSLETLEWDSSSLTEEHIKAIGRCSQLESVILGKRTPVTPQGIRHLAKIPNLVSLSMLAEGHVDDAVLKEVSQLTNLWSLCIDGSKVTDAGIEHLFALPELSFLEIRNSKATSASIQHLLSKKPTLELYLD